MNPTRFAIRVPESTLLDLRERLARVRWPDEVQDAGWDYGAQLSFLREQVRYWQFDFDWRAQERMLNEFAHWRGDVNGFGLHFIHERGRGERPLPLLLLHGFPDSFYRYLKIIPLLTNPAAHGGAMLPIRLT